MVDVAETVVPARVALSTAGDAHAGGAGLGAAAHHLPDTGVYTRGVRDHHPPTLQVRKLIAIIQRRV